MNRALGSWSVRVKDSRVAARVEAARPREGKSRGARQRMGENPVTLPANRAEVGWRKAERRGGRSPTKVTVIGGAPAQRGRGGAASGLQQAVVWRVITGEMEGKCFGLVLAGAL